ncbi:hypothetical protein BC628DRAFT_1072566 [Trametes gibbosa]|nr:hypothetical protein BC628DRAFT_1072566 [Trametes gibbosa]
MRIKQQLDCTRSIRNSAYPQQTPRPPMPKLFPSPGPCDGANVPKILHENQVLWSVETRSPILVAHEPQKYIGIYDLVSTSAAIHDAPCVSSMRKLTPFQTNGFRWFYPELHDLASAPTVSFLLRPYDPAAAATAAAAPQRDAPVCSPVDLARARATPRPIGTHVTPLGHTLLRVPIHAPPVPPRGSLPRAATAAAAAAAGAAAGAAHERQDTTAQVNVRWNAQIAYTTNGLWCPSVPSKGLAVDLWWKELRQPPQEQRQGPQQGPPPPPPPSGGGGGKGGGVVVKRLPGKVYCVYNRPTAACPSETTVMRIYWDGATPWPFVIIPELEFSACDDLSASPAPFACLGWSAEGQPGCKVLMVFKKRQGLATDATLTAEEKEMLGIGLNSSELKASRMARKKDTNSGGRAAGRFP